MTSKGPFYKFINPLVQVLEQIHKRFLTVHKHLLWKQSY